MFLPLLDQASSPNKVMYRLKRTMSVLLIALAACSQPAIEQPLAAQDDSGEVHAFVNAKILTGMGNSFDPGVLLVQDGKIVGVGAVGQLEIPAGAIEHDVRNRVLIPGLVDTHSHLGVSSRPGTPANIDGNEKTGPVQSIVRAIDSLNPNDPGIRMANAGGITTANIMPGSGNVIGGQTVYVKLTGRSAEQMLVEPEGVLGGLKMANGENPKRTYGSRGQAPGTRMKIAALQRSEFIKARNYQQKWRHYRQQLASGGQDVSRPERDLTLEPLVEVLERRRTVHFHSHRADDILTVLRLRQEFDFELVIQHGTEAFKVINEVARHNVPVSMTIVDSPGGKAEVVDLIEECGAELARAGVRVLINTDDPVTESRFFLRTAATPVRGGLSAADALQAITLHSAQALHLDHRIGSLETGKDADFVVLSGEPFSVYTRVLETYIEGVRVFSLADSDDRRFQTGGFGIADRRLLPPPFPLIDAPKAAVDPAGPAGAKQVTETDSRFAILAGRLHTVGQGTIENGVVLIDDGRIQSIGPRDQFNLPAELPILVAREVTPGLIDAHSVVPLNGEYNIPADQDADEESDPNQADVNVLDGFNPSEPLLRFLLEQGVTMVHACPGRDNVLAGTTGVFRTTGTTADKMAVRYPFAMLLNLGEVPKSTYPGQKPQTRMGTAALIRAALNDAQNAKQNKPDQPETIPDLKTAALRRLLDGELRAVFCAQRADDLQTALRLSQEFNLKPILALGAEAYQIRESLREAQVPVIVHPTMQRVNSLETHHTILGNAAALADAGVPISIGSAVEGYVPKTRVIRFEAALAMVYGLGHQRALRSITLDPARLLGIDQDYGSLEAGKVADLVLYDGDPFEHRTHVTHVVVDGKLVHDRSQRPQVQLSQRMLINADAIPCCLSW